MSTNAELISYAADRDRIEEVREAVRQLNGMINQLHREGIVVAVEVTSITALNWRNTQPVIIATFSRPL
jgi:hypothetical protein